MSEWTRKLWLAGFACVLGGCVAREIAPRSEASDVDVAGLRYHAETQLLELDPPRLRTEVTVTNTGAVDREITWPDGCVVLLRAYRDAERAGSPVWDQQRDAVCTMALIRLRLPPGDSHRYAVEVAVPELLGDSLPNGRYYLSALLRPNGETLEVPAGEALLATSHERQPTMSDPDGVGGQPSPISPADTVSPRRGSRTPVRVHLSRNDRPDWHPASGMAHRTRPSLPAADVRRVSSSVWR